MPRELGEAARIDRAGEITVFLRVYAPLARPVIATLAIILLLQNWNNFLFPLIVVNTTKMGVISQGLSVFQSQFTAQYNFTMAAALVAVVLVLAVAVGVQRHIIEGITLGALDQRPSCSVALTASKLRPVPLVPRQGHLTPAGMRREWQPRQRGRMKAVEIQNDDPLAVAIVSAIRQGDVDAVGSLLREHAGLAGARVRDAKGGTRSLLHVVTDWPGYFPGGPEIVRLLIGAGADPNAAVAGSWHSETPLHWAASSDDSEVAVALIDGGADVEAPGASIAGGTPLDDAVGYGCWNVARLLVERGARVESLWHAAALGMTARVEELLDSGPPPSPEEINHAFWQACHGGQRRTAEYLFARGADINAIPDHSKHTPLDIAPGPDTRREAVVSWLREHSARSAEETPAD